MNRADTMTRLLLLLPILCIAIPAEADTPEVERSSSLSEIWLNAGMYSYHYQRNKGLNDSNPGFGVEYRYSSATSFTVGGFYNSDRRNSHYIGWYWQPLSIGSVRFGAALGGFDGYPRMHNGDWFLAAIPTVSYEYQRVGLNLFIIPTYQDRLYGALSFQFKVRVD
jgi:hypothetical protein